MTSATWRLQLLIWCEDLTQRGVLGVRLAGFLFLPVSPSGSEGFYERDAGWGQGALGSCCCVFQDLRKSCYKFRLCPKIWEKNKRKQQKSGKLRRKQNLLLAILRLAAINFLCYFVFCVGSFEASLLTAMETCGKDVRISTIPLACVLKSYWLKR